MEGSETRFESFTLLIGNINRSIRKIKSEEMQEFDLKSVHVSVLYYLHKSPELTASELCELCDEDKANLSRSIEYLEERGFIKPREKCRKRYRAPLELSADGVAVAERIAQKIDGVLSLSDECVDSEEREIMYRCLWKISENLQKICQEYEKNK